MKSMMDRLIHRGPDEGDVYLNASHTATLGHRRLRIIDLATGRQPLGNEDGSVMITFNGEIYGFRICRKRFKTEGTDPRPGQTRRLSSTYMRITASPASRPSRGCSPLLIWDERSQTLMLARDRAGKKPLYYVARRNQLFFASETHALLAVPESLREIDECSLDQYLTLAYIPAPGTIFRNVMKLEAGHYLLVEAGNLHKSRYWAPQSRTAEIMDWQEVQQELISRVPKSDGFANGQ